MLYKVVLTFESVDEMLTCDHSNESCGAVLSCDVVNYATHGGLKLYKSLQHNTSEHNASLSKTVHNQIGLFAIHRYHGATQFTNIIYRI